MARKTGKPILREAWDYRAYLKFETLGKLSLRHKGTYLGYLWWVLDPLLFMCIYYVVFGLILRRGGKAYVLFLFCGLLPWRWFMTSLSEATLSIRGASRMVKQIYFPKVLTPLSSVLSNTMNFFFGLPILFLFMLMFDAELGWNLLLFPVVFLVQFTFTAGLALTLADLNVFFRDTSNLLKYVLQMWFYLSPVLYPIDLVPDNLQPLFRLNPFALIMTGYRDVCIRNQTPDLGGLGVLWGLSLLIVIFGVRQIRAHQGHYAKVL